MGDERSQGVIFMHVIFHTVSITLFTNIFPYYACEHKYKLIQVQ